MLLFELVCDEAASFVAFGDAPEKFGAQGVDEIVVRCVDDLGDKWCAPQTETH